ncbi:MAG: hypothetical protein EKK37_11420 [Sphingobacteriales bacterium]|nr:MAG: hypothetical protein EKK37_11420 [Sphingobacteriales bacterium]
MNDQRKWEENWGQKWKERWEERKRRQNPNSHLWLGAILIVVGIAAIAKSAFFDLPYWLFTWPMILILIGLFSGIKHNFSNNAWWILMLIGGYFLSDEISPGLVEKQYFWPVGIIIVGIVMILKPRRKWDDWSKWDNDHPKTGASSTTGTPPQPAASATADPNTGNAQSQSTSMEDYLDTAAVFGGIKKSVYSKNFRGGKVTCVFGGGEINLSQADFTGTAVLELNAIFGGCTLVIPSNWQLKINTTPFFGGIDDKRQQPNVISYDKTLIITGGVVFGGVEIKSW